MIPWRLRTEIGINFFRYGFIVTISAYVVMGVLVVAAFSAISNNDMEIDTIVGNPIGWAPFNWFFMGMMIVAMVNFVSLIFYVPGLWFLNKGKWEFGTAHSSNVIKGIIFFVTGGVIGVFGGFNTSLIGPFVGIASAILISYGLMLMTMELADKNGKNLLKVATISFVIFGIITALANLWFFLFFFSQENFFIVNDMGFFLWGTVIPMMVNVFNILPLTLFFIVFTRTIHRIKSGQVLPMLPPPPPMMPMPGMQPPFAHGPYP